MTITTDAPAEQDAPAGAETPGAAEQLPEFVPGAFVDLPSLEYMRGYLGHYAGSGPVLDETALGWLDALINEVGHLRDELAEMRVPSTKRRGIGELTETEIKVYRFMRNTQMTLIEISSAMWVSYNTTRTHAKNVYRKLGVHSRAELRAQPRM